MFRQWIENAGPARYSGSGDLTDLWGLIRCKSNRLVGLSQALTQRGYRSIGYSFGAARERIALGLPQSPTKGLTVSRCFYPLCRSGRPRCHRCLGLDPKDLGQGNRRRPGCTSLVRNDHSKGAAIFALI